MEETKLIKKFDLFKKINENDVRALFRCLQVKVVSYKKGDIILKYGDRVEYTYVIARGVARDTIIDKNGNINTHIDYMEGDIFGLEYYINNRKLSLSEIRAVSDVTLILLDSFRLLNPCENSCFRHTQVLQNLIIQLNRQNLTLIRRVKELTKNSSKEKILYYLYNVSLEKKSDEFDIPFNRQELASYLGIERSALSKEISNLQKEQLIECHKNHFKILFKKGEI